jgi:hypothetical protein
MLLSLLLRPFPLPEEPLCGRGVSVVTAVPVVIRAVLDPVEVISMLWPLLMVVMTVVYCVTEVETRGVVLITGVVIGVELDSAGAAVVEDGGSLLLLLDVCGAPLLEAGGVLDGGGLSVVVSAGVSVGVGVGVEDGGGVELGGGVLEGGALDSSADEEVGSSPPVCVSVGVSELPVAVA